MAIRADCPECRRSYNLADELLGKTIRCKGCSHVFVVEERPAEGPDELVAEAIASEPRRARPTSRVAPARSRDREEEEPPRRRPRDEDEDRGREREGGGPNVALLVGLIGGGAALLLVLGGALTWALFSRSPAAPAPAPPGELVRGPNPGGVRPAPVVRLGPGGVERPPAVRPDPKDVRPAPLAWSVRPDPGPVLKGPVDPNGVIPLGPSVPFLYPTRPSPYVAIGQNVTERDARQVWDLETMKQVGTIAGKLASNSAHVLSPDGKYLAGRVWKPTGTLIEVVFADNGRTAQLLPMDKGFAVGGLIDFAGPDQLVVTGSLLVNPVIQVWNLKTGELVRQINSPRFPPDPKTGAAMSPGGRHLAWLDANRVVFCDLAEGKIVGDLPVPAGAGFRTSKGLAFSPDGTELAVLFEGAQPQVVLFDVAKGKWAKTIDLAKGVHKLAPTSRLYGGPALLWLPDRSGWLAFGHFLIDNPSGGVVYVLPNNLEVGFPTQRQVLSKDHLAVATGKLGARQLQILTLPRAQIDLAVKAVRAGGDPSTASLPGLVPADWSAVRQVPPASGALAWKAVPDGLPARKLTAGPIALPVKGTAIERVVFAERAAQAAVLSQTAAEGPTNQRQFRVERYDLTNGEALGGVDLFSSPKAPFGVRQTLAAGLSPDGGLFAAVEPGSGRRIDVWSLAEKKHLVGWVPHPKDKEVKIEWVGFADDKRLLTSFSTGKLVLWGLPKCRATYAVNGFKGAVALSPGRKYLAGFEGGGVTFLEVESGERRGRLMGPAGTALVSCVALAFRLDGTGLAGLFVAAGSGPKLVCWDLKRGEAMGDAPAVGNRGAVSWAGDKHLLLDGTLTDLALKAAIWNYSLPGAGKRAGQGPDGRHWFAAGQGQEGLAHLTAQTLPDAAVRGLLALLARPTTQVLLRPGMSLGVQVEVSGGGGDAAAVRRSTLDAVAQRLRSAGLEVADGSRVVLRIQVTEQATGKTRRYKTVGGGGGTFAVAVKQLTCQATLSGPGGVWWQNRQAIQTPDALMVRTDNAQQYFDRQLWGQAAGWASGVGMAPTFLIRVGGKLEALPKTSVLAGDR